MSSDTRRYEGMRGTLEVSHPAPALLLARLSGHYSDDLIGPYLQAMNAALSKQLTMLAFHDWQAMTSYDSSSRRAMTEWVLENRRPDVQQHILMKSKLVKMGVATANLVIGGHYLCTYEDRAAFEEARRLALRAALDSK